MTPAHLIGAVVGFVLVILVLAAMAPHPLHEPASLSVVPAGYCGTFGAPRSVALVDVAGYQQYRVVCGNGVPLLLSR